MKHPRSRIALSALALGAALALPVSAAAPVAPPPVVLTPVQAAFIQAETRRIEESFVQKVMSITGARRDQVLRAIPAKGRLTDRLARIYSSLERDLGAPLSDEQRALIFAADGERKQALKDLPAQAATR
ncbi:MAG: hypothetical protein PHI64_13190 [Zoogloea sp.]|uniref:hypothetical protein n=1 Tax=Zoogloea sp. TaxID=49181 RepID=UPI00261A2C55|nr:hypothetical protein [Zoogloea sp.]MDD2989904.1 hypothetical protein [Zoogloea sp.]